MLVVSKNAGANSGYALAVKIEKCAHVTDASQIFSDVTFRRLYTLLPTSAFIMDGMQDLDLSDIFDPLAMNVHKQITVLLEHSQARSSISDTQAQILLQHPISSPTLAILSDLLLLPTLTELMSQLFRPLLLDLCARWLDTSNKEEAVFLGLALLIEDHNELFP